MTHRLLCSIAATLLVLSIAPLPSWAQGETGRITGRILDAQGAAVPGAMVTARNVGTGVVRTTVTDMEGIYVLPNLLPAVYEVRVELPGFQPASTILRLTVGATAAFDARLEVGGLTEIVDVTAVEPLVNLRTQEVTTNITGNQLLELPTITRDPYDLVALAGSASREAGVEITRGAGFTLNGLRASATNVLLDGASNNDEFTGDVGQAVPLDAVQEFTVISNNFLPQYGRASAGIVNLTVKSGTNQFRGSAYEFFRNDALATNTFENKARGIEQGEFDRHQYGGSLGGPIRRDRIFFFGSFEGIRVRSVDTQSVWVPTAQFLALTAANTRAFFAPHQVVATPSGTVLTRGEIGGTPGGPFAALPADLPAFEEVQRTRPTDAGGGSPQDTAMIVGRVDWAVSPNATFYARYALERKDFLAGSSARWSPYTGFDSPELDRNHNILASVTNVWSARFTTQSKVVFNRLENSQPLGDQPAGPTLYARSVATRVNGVLIGFPGYLPFNPGTAIPFGGPQNFIQLYEDATWLRGNHDLRFGGTFVHMRDNRTFGAFQNSVQTLGTSLNQAMDNLVLGQLASFSGAIDPQGRFPGEIVTLPVSPPLFSRNNRYNEWALYFNDAWSVTPRLTLNLGLRYEYFGVQQNADPRLDANFYYGSGNQFERIRTGRVMVAPESPVGGLWRPDYNNIAPRIGFAYDLRGDGRETIRGGYGMGYERNFGNVTFNVIQNPPHYAVISIVAGADVPTIPISAENAGPMAGTGTVVLPRTSLRHVDEDIVNAYAHFWSLSYQRQLGPGLAASVDYSGSRGVDLYTLEDPNAPGTGAVYLGDDSPTSRLNSQYSNMNTRGNGGRSQYHGVIFGLDARQLGETGLSVTGRYTLGWAKDNLSTTFSESNNAFTLGLLDPFDPDLDWGWADFDVRHRLTVGALWQMPFARDRGGLYEGILGGWQLATVFTAQTGMPFTVFDCSNSVAGYFRCMRMRVVAPLPGRLNTPRPTGDPNTFVYMDLGNQADGIGTYVNPITGTDILGPFPGDMLERNALRRPGRWNADLILSKRFAMFNRSGLQVRLEAYNVFNHANLYIRDAETDLSASTEILAFRGRTGPFDGAVAGDGQRRLQLGLRFDW